MVFINKLHKLSLSKKNEGSVSGLITNVVVLNIVLTVLINWYFINSELDAGLRSLNDFRRLEPAQLLLVVICLPVYNYLTDQPSDQFEPLQILQDKVSKLKDIEELAR